MNKRTDRIRSLFTAPQAEALSADNMVAQPRVTSGSVRSLQDSFSGVERENEELREQLASGVAVVEIAADLIEPSPVADRFAEVEDAGFEALKASIAERGQEVPVLVRPHPARTGRFQCAYGHRRVRVALELGRPVRAVVRPLSDEDLVVAQGVENSARQDLSFVERAVFALKLEQAGHPRAVVQAALTIDRAEASKLVAVARAVPADIVAAIGRAPRIGRGRWQAFGAAVEQPGALGRIRTRMAAADFAGLDSDGRFGALLAAAAAPAKAAGAGEAKASEPGSGVVSAASGAKIARVDRSRKETRIILDRGDQDGFAAFLVEALPELFERYARMEREDGSGARMGRAPGSEE
ncbi:chromosome partitioning protein, ParB family [Pseudoxanthobacter soli DSM 19599]|uniref:Chromosome partitioning protein, ParB family n=2 Tax=Pseudoxanthobacter TaxID=433838 RepID=A0A1M7ZQ16_9HYPH|nr:plasmid partitioning protein RepB [Pseudoxanthobacter soli]SHO66902.1 chromosome partitioning protein, ParB family [Pseudoxanthobacter soli DSM 19599]